jgi:hypothetical protein
MKNNFNRLNLLAYIHNPISLNDMIKIYDENNIKYDNCVLYGDFVQSFLGLIFDTYLGDEYTNLENQLKHFDWCWNKTINNFKKEGLNFREIKLYQYFLEFVLEVFYYDTNKENQKDLNESLLSIWYNIFDYNKEKTNADIDTLLGLYKIFEKILKK